MASRDYYHIMQTFVEKHMPTLDVAVMGALELFMSQKVPLVKVPYKRPLVVGSGNAEVVGRLLFEHYNAVFANESTYGKLLAKKNLFDGVVIISASGSKHAPIIARAVKRARLRVTFITATKDSLTEKVLDPRTDSVYVFPKQREPYTYNVSTYLGMILGSTSESPKQIYTYLQNRIARIRFPDFSQYDKYFFILPPRFDGLKPMLHTKFSELFGRTVARDIETTEHIKHATTVVPSDELFISFGSKNTLFGRHRLTIPLRRGAGWGEMIAIAYYVIGKIQSGRDPVFKEHLGNYVKTASKFFNKNLKVIVE